MKVYTTKTGAKVLGLKQDTLKRYAQKYGIGSQPGGPYTAYLFTLDDLMKIGARERKWKEIEQAEDREELGLPPRFDPSVIKNKRRSRRDGVQESDTQRAGEGADQGAGEGDGPEHEPDSEAVREDQED